MANAGPGPNDPWATPTRTDPWATPPQLPVMDHTDIHPDAYDLWATPTTLPPSPLSTALGNTIKRKAIADPWVDSPVPPEDPWAFTYDDPDPTTCAAASADASVEFDATSPIRAAPNRLTSKLSTPRQRVRFNQPPSDSEWGTRVHANNQGWATTHEDILRTGIRTFCILPDQVREPIMIHMMKIIMVFMIIITCIMCYMNTYIMSCMMKNIMSFMMKYIMICMMKYDMTYTIL